MSKTNIQLLRDWQAAHPGKVCRFRAGGWRSEYGIQTVVKWPKWDERGYPSEDRGVVMHDRGEHDFDKAVLWDSDASGPYGITILADEPAQPQPDGIDWRLIERALTALAEADAARIEKQIALVRAKL